MAPTLGYKYPHLAALVNGGIKATTGQLLFLDLEFRSFPSYSPELSPGYLLYKRLEMERLERQICISIIVDSGF